jgi:uncharacterized protein (DUF2235 family)
MPRNIVICCDGTGNKFGVRNTNIVKLCEVLDRSGGDQIVYYDPGVGTLGDQSALTRIKKNLTRALGGAIGFGIRADIQEAYDFLAWHYQPGDRVLLFGFSRGAYAVRALAALIHMYGLSGPGNGNLTPYLLSMQANDDPAQGTSRWRTANRFRLTFGRRVPIHFLGVFDTVSSVGWFWNPVKLPYTRTNPSVARVRHAVSIDERRAFFRTNLFAPAKDQDLKEVWFPGVHSDVGGGYPDAEHGLAQITFTWMVTEAAAAGLQVDKERLADVLTSRTYAVPDSCAAAHESLVGWWRLMELLPKPRAMSYVEPGGRRRWQWPFRINLWRPRRIPPGATIHRSVLDRYQKLNYRPGNLGDPASYPVESSGLSLATPAGSLTEVVPQ